MLAFSPLVVVAVLFAGAVLQIALPAPHPAVPIAGVVVLQGLWLACALVDRSRLGALGFPSLPSWGWALLAPLAYLIVRFVKTRKLSVGSSAALSAHVAVILTAPFVIGLVAAVLVPTFLSEQSEVSADDETPAPNESREIERIITEEEAKREVYLFIECPDQPATFTPGFAFECTAANTTSRVRTFTVTWGETHADGFTWTDPSAD